MLPCSGPHIYASGVSLFLGRCCFTRSIFPLPVEESKSSDLINEDQKKFLKSAFQLETDNFGFFPDINLNLAISDKQEETDLYFYHSSSPINTLNKSIAKFQKASVNEIKKIKTVTLNDVLKKINFYEEIDYLNIDVEGMELNVLAGFNITKFKPKVISVEFLDLKIKKLEFKNNNVDNLINSDLYKHLIRNEYYFVNWLHGDLIFIHKDFRD